MSSGGMPGDRMKAMAVEKLTPERRRQLTRDALLDAAAQVFARRGFNGASLDEIAETAGFTRGAIYKHFADKEDLLFAVSERFNERAAPGIQRSPRDHRPGRQSPGRGGRVDGHARQGTRVLHARRGVQPLPAAQSRGPGPVVERRHEQARRIGAFMEEQDTALGIPMPMPAADLASMFLVTSDGFTMASLIDPEIAVALRDVPRDLREGRMGRRVRACSPRRRHRSKGYSTFEAGASIPRASNDQPASSP